MTTQIAATEQAQSLSDAITRDAAQLLQMYGTGAVQLPIKGTDQYVIAGTLDAIARAVPVTAAEHPAGELTDEQIFDLVAQYRSPGGSRADLPRFTAKDALHFARAIERAAIVAHLAGQSQATRAVPEEIAGVNIARLLRNLEETSYNEGSVDLACRLSDCQAVIKHLLAAPTAQEASQDVVWAEPVAWMQDDGKLCTTAESKKHMETCGFGHWAQIAARYTIPLYAAPATATTTQATPDASRAALMLDRLHAALEPYLVDSFEDALAKVRDLVRADVERRSAQQNLLRWALRELLGALPERRDWFNPDAERVLRAVAEAGPVPAQEVTQQAAKAETAEQSPSAKVIITDGNGTATIMLAPGAELKVGANLYLAPTTSTVSAPTGRQYIPANFTTHRAAWREALTFVRDASMGDGAAYWQHELNAYDRAFARLLDNPEPVKAEGTVSAPEEVREQWPAEPTPEMQQAGASAIRFDTTVLNKLWTANAVYRAIREVALRTTSGKGEAA
jgi:hypothetical protein